MPVIEDIQLSSMTRIMVWEIKETIDFLKSELDLSDLSKKKLSKKKSEIHQKQFLAVRNILKLLSIHDSDIGYDVDGKPFINFGYLSTSHSKEYVVVIISDENVGVDIESNSDKCFRIIQKFLGTENEFPMKIDWKIAQVIWNMKESLFKMMDFKEIDFKENFIVIPFSLNENQTKIWFVKNELSRVYNANYFINKNYSFAYIIDKQ
jgi:4'-phosphopantetheinyl transferase EntD